LAGALVLLCGFAAAQAVPPAPVPQTTTGAQAPSAQTNPAAVPQASKTELPAQTTETPEQAQERLDTSLADLGPGLSTSVWEWKGLRVNNIKFEGVTFEAGDKLPSELAQQAGQPFDPEKVRESTRRLFASGRYRNIEVRGERQGDGMTLIFAGSPRYYVGRVTIAGVKSERLTSLLEYATKLSPGTGLTRSAVPDGMDGIIQTLQQQGYYQPKVSVKTETDDAAEQVNVTYTVALGPQARIGVVTVEGDAGMTVEEFKKKGKLKTGKKVTRDTTSNALAKLRAQYQKKDRLEAVVTLQKQTYAPTRKQLDYDFHADQGPVVKVLVEGASFSRSRLHLLVPIYEEGTIDNDLLNEAVFNIRDYLQQKGYFDADVKVKLIGENTPSEKVVFTVDRGVKHKVVAVNIKGNKYFDTDLLRERMNVQKANLYMRSGRYSPSLVTGDVNSIEALYRANGFDQAKVTTDVRDVDSAPNGKQLKAAEISVTYTVVEGRQQKFGSINLTGVDPSRMKEIKGMMNSQSGQPFSLVTLSGDRDAVLGYYLSHGFDQAKVEVRQDKDHADETRVNVTLNVTEGPQVFINHVLVSGIELTRPKVVEKNILVHPEDPLDQSALLETQRKLYNMALFNEVVTAVQNPTGNAPTKNVLVQVTEAKRWNVTYGFGLEAQTGTPSRGHISEASCIQLGRGPDCGSNLSQEGKTGVSPRVSLDVSRINLRGTEDSLTLHTSYGLLEEIGMLTFQNPHWFGSKDFSASLSGGYSNVQDITTFSSSRLQGDFRVTQKFRRADTFIYDFQYRRVKVSNLQISADLIPQLSQPVRVGGPGVTWFHDTRSPTPLDAAKGSYTTIQAFLASSKFGSQADFYKLDGTNSTYYQFGKQKYVLARNTRIGYERAWGTNLNATTDVCQGDLLTTNPSCDAVPLPERLYAGGASSHRGFGINGAGPRDLQTGYPVGGKAVFVNTLELRLPPPVLPYVGSSVSFVLFHDMGNVFQNAGDMFPSLLRFHQPDKDSCYDVSGKIGKCNFNYFSHAVGLGARYKTPVGPIRVDFSYNLNPPVYPVIYDFNNSPPHVGRAGHFNFFFSIGQSF
jgi:outer membrane protein assembly complex protein YaeT